MIFHALAADDFIGVVMTEGQRIGAVWTFIFDFLDVAEKAGGHGWFLPWIGRVFGAGGCCSPPGKLNAKAA